MRTRTIRRHVARHSALARRNPAARTPKNPMVVVVRRFDPSGEELTTWAPLYGDDEGVTLFSPTKAKAAALAPPRDADLHVGDLIVTVPAEAVSGIEEYATGLFVVTPDGVERAPKLASGISGSWLIGWGESAWVMLRAARKVDRRRLTMAACDCAETVPHFVPAGEERPRIAIQTARAWCFNRASTDDVRAAANAVDAFTSAGFAYGTNYLVDRAACAAASAASSAARAASDLDGGGIFGAFGGADYDAANASFPGTPRETTYRALAPLVERWIPLPVVLLSRLGYPNAIPFNPSLVPGSSTGPRENPRRNQHPTARRRAHRRSRR